MLLFAAWEGLLLGCVWLDFGLMFHSTTRNVTPPGSLLNVVGVTYLIPALVTVFAALFVPAIGVIALYVRRLGPPMPMQAALRVALERASYAPGITAETFAAVGATGLAVASIGWAVDSAALIVRGSGAGSSVLAMSLLIAPLFLSGAVILIGQALCGPTKAIRARASQLEPLGMRVPLRLVGILLWLALPGLLVTAAVQIVVTGLPHASPIVSATAVVATIVTLARWLDVLPAVELVMHRRGAAQAWHSGAGFAAAEAADADLLPRPVRVGRLEMPIDDLPLRLVLHVLLTCPLVPGAIAPILLCLT
ncbi:MAG: hypothetical protein AB7S36_01520 [Planctomycetota bacterium]